MGRKKKPFIDKKSAHKFGLVHRSQRDPLQVDEDESQRVLLPLAQSNAPKPHNDGGPCENEAEKRREQQKLHGIYFEDNYDYLQHLKPRGECVLVETTPGPSGESSSETKQFGNVALPSGLFASETEENEGMLLRGVIDSGFNPNLDPDIVEALDGDIDLEDPENLLEDDFMALAHGEGEQCEGDDNSDFSGSDFGSGFEDDDMFGEETHFDKKSRFTEYSMTSSVIRRTDGLQLLDRQFETLMADYDEEKIGGLDEDVTTGHCDVHDVLIDNAIHDFEQNMQVNRLDMDTGEALIGEDTLEEGDTSVDYDITDEPRKELWDCESMVSTYSNLYNHPKIIDDDKSTRKPIKLLGRQGIPEGILRKKELNKSDIENDLLCVKKVGIARPKDETLNDKKERKQAVKEERRARRVEKKERQIAFKSEKIKQEKATLGRVSQIAL